MQIQKNIVRKNRIRNYIQFPRLHCFINNFFRVQFNRDRIYGLDILRALAILFVVIEHGSIYLPIKLHDNLNLIVFDGVSIFFVLSGFLIGGILIKILEKNKASIKTLFNFWIRRWFRTLPNYYLVLFLLMFIPYIYNWGMSNPFKKMEYLFFLQNLNNPHPNLFEEAWSLCVEEWFYLIVPIIIFLLVGSVRLPVKKAVLISAFVIMITSMIFRYIKYLNIPIESITDWDMNIRKQVFTRLDSNMFGLVGAFVSFYYKEAWKKHKNVLLIIGIIILLFHRYIIPFGVSFGIYECVFSFSLVSLGVLFILPFLSEYKKGSGIIYNFFTFISIISYSLYLCNYSLFKTYGLYIFNHFYLTGPTFIIARYLWYWGFSIFGSFLLYKFYEKPMMDLREKFR
jgi:peptidoglycan/LPS O-acetylase OafA/YrhL